MTTTVTALALKVNGLQEQLDSHLDEIKPINIEHQRLVIDVENIKQDNIKRDRQMEVLKLEILTQLEKSEANLKQDVIGTRSDIASLRSELVQFAIQAGTDRRNS